MGIRCSRGGGPLPPSREWGELDENLFIAVAQVVAWASTSWDVWLDGPVSLEAWRFLRDMVAICDGAMPQAGPLKARNRAHWWSAEIGRLCVRSNRLCGRCTWARKRWLPQHFIVRAKSRAWEEILAAAHGDPWGRAYRLGWNSYLKE